MFGYHPYTRFLTLVITLGVVMPGFTADNDYRIFQAGYAELDITPTKEQLKTGRVYLAGYGLWTERGPALGVHDPLSVRTICLQLNEAFCLSVTDSLGLPGRLIREIQDLASARIEVPSQNLLVAATHTHAAPDLVGLWGGAPDSYRERVKQQVAATMVSAYHQRRPVILRMGRSRASAHNRRGWGQTIDTLVTLSGEDQETGERLFNVVNFAVHPVVSRQQNRLVSSDLVHTLRYALEQRSGAPVLFVNGALGDVNPFAELDHEKIWQVAQQYGESLAQTAQTALEGELPLAPFLELQVQPFQTPIDNLPLSLAHTLGLIDDDSTGPPWARQAQGRLVYLRLGHRFNALAIPGEALTRTGISMLAALPQSNATILGLTGGCLGYIVLADEWHSGRNDNYEESVSVGSHFADQLLRLISSLSISPTESISR